MMRKKIFLKLRLFSVSAGALALAGCGGGDDGGFADVDRSGDVEAWYAENPEFFRFAGPDDIPDGLVWENGMDLPDLGSPEAKKGGTMEYYISDFPRTLRTLGPDANGGFRSYMHDDVVMNYAHRHPNTDEVSYYPGLAEEWAIDREDHTVYIRLHPEARWSDGEPVTSDDAVFSFYFHQNPANRAPWYNNFYFEMYASVTRYDERTFSIKTAEAKPDFESYALELSPRPRRFYKAFGDDYVQRYQWKFQPTTGAYVVLDEDIRKGNSIALTRNEDWWARDRKFWRNRYNPDKVMFTVVRDPGKAFEVFTTGKIDMFGMSLAEFNYEKLPDSHPLVENGYIHKATFYNDIPRSGFGVWMNTAKPLLDNVHIRKGIRHAMNFELVIDEFFRGEWTREQTSADGFGELTHPDIKAPEFSVAKAEEQFAMAGFTRRGPDGILVNDAGQRLSFGLTTGYKELEDVLTILEREARKAGVELQLEVLEQTAAWKKVQEKNHDLSLTGFGISITERYPRYWENWHGENAYEEDGSLKVQTNNLTSTNIPELNDLIIRYRKSESHDEKAELSRRIEEILYDHAAYVPGVYRPFYRLAYWRWVRWPDDFNVNLSYTPLEQWLHWIDPERKRETLAAMRANETFPASIEIFDQHRPQ